MVFLFRRPRADTDIEVGSGALYPGSTISLLVSLCPLEGFRVRKGRMELVCTETYQEVEAGPDGAGGTQVTVHRVILSELFLCNTNVARETTYRSELRFTLPTNARPTFESSTAGITWSLSALLDIPLARDIHKKKEITVLTHPL